MKAGIEPAAGAECVAAADDLQVHKGPPATNGPQSRVGRSDETHCCVGREKNP
jgi:hypothetical protein